MSHDGPVVPPLAARGQLNLSLDELLHWGIELGEAAAPPLLICLKGELGAGKTTLAQAICEGYGVEDEVTSPTYALVHGYAAEKSPVYHVDLYRLNNESELTNIGWDDMLAARALVLVEWPERAGCRLPGNHISIALEYVANEPSRRILFAG